jgi:hypothetical protein
LERRREREKERKREREKERKQEGEVCGCEGMQVYRREGEKQRGSVKRLKKYAKLLLKIN